MKKETPPTPPSSAPTVITTGAVSSASASPVEATPETSAQSAGFREATVGTDGTLQGLNAGQRVLVLSFPLPKGTKVERLPSAEIGGGRLKHGLLVQWLE